MVGIIILLSWHNKNLVLVSWSVRKGNGAEEGEKLGGGSDGPKDRVAGGLRQMSRNMTFCDTPYTINEPSEAPVSDSMTNSNNFLYGYSIFHARIIFIL